MPRGSACPACGREQKSGGGLRQSKDGLLLKCFKCGWSGWAGGRRPARLQRAEEPAPVPTRFVPREAALPWLENRRASPLFRWMAGLFGAEAADRAFLRYGVGCLPDRPECAVYLTIDERKRIRSVKAMAYGEDGKRLKTPGATFSPKPYTGEAYRAALFGLHLVEADSRLVVVESEKTALMCACLQPEGAVFVALGGAQTYGQRVGASRDHLKALGMRRAWYWPDRDRAGAESVAGVRAMFRTAGVALDAGDLTRLWPACPEGADLGDYLLWRLGGGAVASAVPVAPVLDSEAAALKAKLWGAPALPDVPAHILAFWDEPGGSWD